MVFKKLTEGAEPVEILGLIASVLGLLKGSGGATSGKLKSFMDGGGAKILEQQVPKMFGVGFEENSVTAYLYSKLGLEKSAKLERLLKAMTDYERYFFWMTITSIKVMPASTTKTVKKDDKKAGDEPQEEVVQETITAAELDDRVRTLNMIVDRIGDTPDERMREVVNSLYTMRILEQNAAMKAWTMFSKGFKVTVLDPLGVSSLSEAMEKFNTNPKIAAWIQARNAKRAEPVPMSLWGRFANTGLSGSKPVPEPLLQGDGAIKATLRMLGIPTRRK